MTILNEGFRPHQLLRTILVVGTLLLCPPIYAQSETGETPTEAVDADASDGPPESAQKVDIKPTANDSDIQTRISRILKASNWFDDVNVKVDEGIVILDGRANEIRYRDWAGNMCRNVEDVVAVVNNITVTDKNLFDLSKSSTHVTSSLRSLWRDFLERMPLIAVGFIILGIAWIVDWAAASLVRRSAKRAKLRTSLQDLLVQLAIFVTWVVGIMIAAVVVFPGMTPAKLLTVLGLGSVALGFAFKDIFENFFAGILILWRFPFDKGDFIECGDIVGKVEDITIRMSQIRQVDGQLVVVPNAMLFKNPVTVMTSMDLRRTTLICGVAYGEDVDGCRGIIETAVQSCPTVSTSRAVEIFATEFGASSIDFEVTWWTGSTPLELRRSRDEVVAAVKRALDESGVEIPFPYRTLTFKHPLPLEGSLAIQQEGASEEGTSN